MSEPVRTPLREPSGEAPDALGVLRDRLAALTLHDEDRLKRRLDSVAGTRDSARREERLSELLGAMEEAEARVQRRRAAVPAVSYPPQLPVSGRREDLQEAIATHQVMVVAGETGSGKTTQLPKLCLELGRGVRGAIAHTQPRRLAARTVAERIAEELGVPLGEAVGYAVRFSDVSRADTLVRLVTDGLLLAEIRHDPLLRRYDTVIVDEAHERSLNIDFLLGYLKRILPRRPDLKLIITSATIDPERFARHFGGAPVVEVSGRTYPVEVRYRPLELPAAGSDDEDGAEPATTAVRDEVDAVGDAVDELMREPPGDVLVFLSGEREIRDAAEALRGRLPSDVDVLPLYARLSAADQQRVFRPHRARRRIVLATNVAETSLTVPGIRYVVDPGNARISRYSARLKVQRLPIERVSRASADQRKGRCGRTSEGICIRLYSEEDFAARPEFTDPEILRTSLASVILQMASAGLGAVEDFPFLDPPDARQVRDGINLLVELGALDPARRLTPLGRRLAGLPVDPRLARMILEAERLGCVQEVVVIVAALSIQDPRERPADAQGAADEQHRRFADERSDFLAFLNLWRHLREGREALSGSQFRKRCKAEFLNYLRVREWQDLVSQLRQAAKSVGVATSSSSDDYRAIHVALLSGLLSHVGMRDPRRREYAGARGGRFAIFPGSALARAQPSWVMVAELVETSRLWGRTAARIDPAWIEPLAGHLLKRTYESPRWERRRGSVVALERATLFGLPVVGGRRVPYGAIDPALSREEFIRRALVGGDWTTRHAFFHANHRLREELSELEERARRRDLLAGEDALFAFYDERIPPEVVSGAHFDTWWKKARRSEPEKLTLTPELLLDPAAADLLDAEARPLRWRRGGLDLELSYRFDPGDPRDGVTVHVPLEQLAELRAEYFDWLVPALREELATTLIRALAKDVRRRLVPVPETVAALLPRLDTTRPVPEALAAALEEVRGVRVAPAALDLDALPPHLRMTYRVLDEAGAVLGEGNDLAALREQLRPALRERLDDVTRALRRTGMRGWELGELPREVALPGTGGHVKGWPALVDEGQSVGVAVLEDAAAQARSMRAGTRRLLRLTIASPVRRLRDGLDLQSGLVLSAFPHGGLAAVLDDAVDCALDALLAGAGGPVWDPVAFEVMRTRIARQLPDVARTVLERMAAVLRAANEVSVRLDQPAAPALAPARADVARQLERLVAPGFATRVGYARLRDVERYLRGAARRLDRLPQAAAADADRMRTVAELEEAWSQAAAAVRGGDETPPALEEARWMLEELRVAQFAQGVGSRGPASAKRVRRLIERAGAAA